MTELVLGSLIGTNCVSMVNYLNFVREVGGEGVNVGGDGLRFSG